ncbi:laminin a family protein, putative [Ichthyophthirius multifiliis]|uniref:Laminin a family protein, putative n=1 Tax=Ichthyophthirius multifiliis TaxID=5932 RepID=G0QYW0_ICHMU|nr:laminin a family protein, putative [Ichthyophthirius multifiliis]EGR29595.1 laminin a family protein, putative [Ichthyophthirius multifiliis]|eukprot:XP_004030831.1 laminin a family protein, putative [Ichthyophthirius multifiliis]
MQQSQYPSKVAQSRLVRPDGEGGRQKAPVKSLQETHKEMLKNIESTNIGKPTIVEAQRILKIIDNLYMNLQVFSYLDAEFVNKFLDITKNNKLSKELVQQLSPKCLELLKQQAEIESKFKLYAHLLDQASKEEEEVEEDKKIEAEKLRKMLENNFKDLIRYIRGNNQDFEIIKSLKPNINPDLNDLVHCIHCQRVIMLKKLSTASEEEESHKIQLEELIQRICFQEQKRNNFEQDLKKLKEERQKFYKEKKDEIEKLKAEIGEVKADKLKKANQLKNETDLRKKQLEKNHESAKERLNKELDKLKEEFNKLQVEHATEETKLKQKKVTSQNGLEDNIKQYDVTMEELHKIKKDLEDELSKIKEESESLKEDLAKVDDEKSREKELYEEFKLKKEQWEIQERRKKEASRCILNYLVQKKGWDILKIHTNKQFSDSEQLFAAGILESTASFDMIYDAYFNYLYGILNGNDLFLTFDQFYYLTNMGDLEDIVNAFKKTNKTQQNCNAYVKITPEDLICGHSTFNNYSLMLRIYKYIENNFSNKDIQSNNQSFSSRPGDLQSKDDFYTLSSGIVVMETSLNNYNISNYQNLHFDSLPCWLRANLANRLAKNASDWAHIFQKYRSGTHNNQWLVVDYNKYRSGQKKDIIWIVEESFELFKAKDVSDMLFSDGYFASYNVPFDQEIYNSTMYKEGYGFNYQNDPRAILFKEHSKNVTNTQGVMEIIRLNHNETGNPCNSLAPRCDLILNGPYLFGGIDGKVTNNELLKQNQVLMISGPTQDGFEAFDWGKWQNFPHKGMPEKFDFDWIKVNLDNFKEEQLIQIQ